MKTTGRRATIVDEDEKAIGIKKGVLGFWRWSGKL
jgi:hypothetical protein